MKEEIAIVCSRIDPASLNIAERLLELVDWQGHGDYMSSGPWRLLIHDRVQSSFHGIDHFVSDLGLCPKLIIFPCRHEAKSMIPWLGGHFAGILKGENPALSVAAPWALKSFLSTIKNFAP